MLHTGMDGGLHDVIGNSLLSALTWGLLIVNAIVFYSREAWKRFKGRS